MPLHYYDTISGMVNDIFGEIVDNVIEVSMDLLCHGPTTGSDFSDTMLVELKVSAF